MCLSTLAALGADPNPQLTNLPTLYINTENKQPILDKENYVKASIVWVDGTGTTTYDNNLGIRGRGNSTWNLAKKPYRIKFDKKTEFLGPERAKAKSWTLLANYGDKTLIRNAVASCIGKFMGQPFTAANTYVDFVLNGVYQGNYQISDQIEVNNKRIEITEQKDPATAESNITGGYFLEVDGFGEVEPVFFRTPRGVIITVKSPDDNIINQAQKDYIQGHIAAFENALFSNNFTDPVNGYRKYVDAPTLASWYIATELTGNVDGFWSTNIYKEKDDDKIYWGPLWDYDIAFNNCDRVGDVSNKLMADAGFGQNLSKMWICRMWEDPWFVNLINETWKEYVENGIVDHVLAYIDNLAAQMEQSQSRNFRKWPINQKVYNEIMLFNTYAEGIEYLKDFVVMHADFLTYAFEERAYLNPGETQPFQLDNRYYYAITNKGCSKNVAPNAGNQLAIYTANNQNQAQHWVITQSGEYFNIVNRSNNLAVTDATTFTGTQYVGGTVLSLKELDPSDPAQQWTFAPIATGGTYCIVNRKTGLGWNNNGGSNVDGNSVISWTSNADNVNKPTRQWTFTKAARNETQQGIEDAFKQSPQYHLSYVPELQQLHFVSHSDEEICGNVKVFNASGQLLMDCPIAEYVDVQSLPSGLLIVAWEVPGEKPRTVKFTR